MNGVEGILTGAQLDETVDRDRVDAAPRRQHPVDPGWPHRPVEPRRGRDGTRPRRPPRTRPSGPTSGSGACRTPTASWHAYYVGNEIKDPTLDTNVACYVAIGVWHHYLCTGDTAFLRELWPMVERTIDYALAYQTETGEIAWRADDPADGALLTGSSSIHLSLRCAIAIAERLGHDRPDWELSLGALAIAIAHRPERFLDKERWAMDWYYPILGGVLRGQAAQLRIAHYWDTFVVEGRGVRCVSDQPWVTAAETCELVMALDAIGETEQARDLFALGAVPPPRRRRVLVRHELRRRALPPRSASTSPPTTRRGTPRRSCSPRTRSATRARPPACSAARHSPPA